MEERSLNADPSLISKQVSHIITSYSVLLNEENTVGKPLHADPKLYADNSLMVLSSFSKKLLKQMESLVEKEELKFLISPQKDMITIEEPYFGPEMKIYIFEPHKLDRFDLEQLKH